MNHIVDEEVQSRIKEASSGYVFTSEEEYYSDIQAANHPVQFLDQNH